MRAELEQLEVLIFKELRWNNTTTSAWLSAVFNRDILTIQELTESEQHLAIGLLTQQLTEAKEEKAVD